MVSKLELGSCFSFRNDESKKKKAFLNCSIYHVFCFCFHVLMWYLKWTVSHASKVFGPLRLHIEL